MMKNIFSLFVLAVCSAILGCGPKGLDTQYIEGVVKLDGQLLPGASVTFVPLTEGGQNAGGISDDNGVYRLSSLYGEGGKGALIGDYAVLVSKSKVVPLPKPIKYDDGTESTHTSEPMLNAVYRDKNKTPLKYTVVKGKNTFNIELSGKP